MYVNGFHGRTRQRGVATLGDHEFSVLITTLSSYGTLCSQKVVIVNTETRFQITTT